jgi:hypothetical protein
MTTPAQDPNPQQAILDSVFSDDVPVPTFDTPTPTVVDDSGRVTADPSVKPVPPVRQEAAAPEGEEVSAEEALSEGDEQVEQPAADAPEAELQVAPTPAATPQPQQVSATEIAKAIVEAQELARKAALPPPPVAKLPQENALEAFYDPETRARVVKHVLGAHYEPGMESNKTALATVESFLHSELKSAQVDAKLAAFETQQRQAVQSAQQMEAQAQANNLFQQNLAKYVDVTPDFQETLADLVELNQRKGMNLQQATTEAFKRGQQLGLRPKGTKGAPTTQQRAVIGREAAHAVIRQPTGAPPSPKASDQARTVNDIIKMAFS